MSHVPEGRDRRVGPWQQVVEAAVGIALDDASDDVGQIPGVPKWVVGDRGYSSHRFREHIWDTGARPAIPTKRNEAPVACPNWVYNNRNMVERLWARLKEWRAIAILASAAGIAGPAHDEDPHLSRHDVESLGHVLADPMQAARAAWADEVLNVDHVLDSSR